MFCSYPAVAVWHITDVPRITDRDERLGRSHGCPVLPPGLNATIIDLIRDGSVIFGYYPDDRYINGSMILSFRPGRKAEDLL
jgi:hypothetical protein